MLGRGTLIHFNTQVRDFAARFKGVSKDSLEPRDLQDWEVVKRRSKLVLKFDIHLRVEKIPDNCQQSFCLPVLAITISLSMICIKGKEPKGTEMNFREDKNISR